LKGFQSHHNGIEIIEYLLYLQMQDIVPIAP